MTAGVCLSRDDGPHRQTGSQQIHTQIQTQFIEMQTIFRVLPS